MIFVSTAHLICSLLLLPSIGEWEFSPKTIVEYGISNPTFSDEEFGTGLICDASNMPLNDLGSVDLPTRAFTIEAVVSLDEPLRWGGIVGCVQDNGEEEKGWVLGYNESQFTIGLSTTGADDGDGKMTYLTSGEHTYDLGRWYALVATYDGVSLRLYVNGTLANESLSNQEIFYMATNRHLLLEGT